MPEMRMNSLKSRAMNCGPLSEMIRGFASGYFSLAHSRMTSMSDSLMISPGFIETSGAHGMIVDIAQGSGIFLSSDRGAFISGADYIVDGGTIPTT
jgi:hypothetical protein